MSKFKIGGEDLLVGWRSLLNNIYEVDGLDCAKDFLDAIIRCVNKSPELYGDELLPAIMRLKIVKKIQKEVNHDRGTKDARK